MSSVMVGMFDSEMAANKARSALSNAGFPNGAVTMTAQPGSASPSDGRADATREEEEEGGITGFFKSIFGDSDDSRDGDRNTYREAIRRGAYGVSVSASSDYQANQAEKILNDCGAVDIDERSAQWRSDGWNDADADVRSESMAGGDTRKVDLVQEELNVGKRAVARGGVRVHTRVTEVPVEETINLRDEKVGVERHKVDRPATEADLAAFKDGSIEVRATSEKAMVSKDARVVGEVEIGKTVTQHDETVRDTVRKTDVDVERMDPEAPGSRPTK